MLPYLRLRIIVADNVCQFFNSPLCCRVLCSEITVRVQVQNDNAVAGEVIVCQQFLIQNRWQSGM